MTGGESSSAPAPAAPTASAGWTSGTSAPNIKLDRFPKLTGQTDYRIWRDSAEYILQTMGCWSLVADDEQEPTKEEKEDSNYEEQVNTYRSRYRWTSVFILETVDFQWLPVVAANETPSRVWEALLGRFARESTVSFHSQFASLLGLRVTSKSNLASTITKFNTE